MKILFSSTRDKLPVEPQPDLSDYGDSWEGPWLWVVHPGVDPETFLEENEKDVQTCVDRGGALLFISGSPRCGLVEDKALEIEAEKKGRVHFLRTACGDSPVNSPPTLVVERILRFLKLVDGLKAHDDLPWSEVECSLWPENLVAVYLIMKAIETSSKNAPAIRNAWSRMDPTWKKQIWGNAWKEYREELNMNAVSWSDAGLPTLEGDLEMPGSSNLAAAIATIRRAFPG